MELLLKRKKNCFWSSVSWTSITNLAQKLTIQIDPGGAGQSVAPPALDLKVPCLDDELGSYTFTLQSQNITVAGLLLFRFNLIRAPNLIKILSIKVKIFQKVLLKSQIDGEIVEVPPDPRTVFRLDQHTRPNNGIPSTSRTGESGSRTPISGVPLQILEVEESWKFMHLARYDWVIFFLYFTEIVLI